MDDKEDIERWLRELKEGDLESFPKLYSGLQEHILAVARKKLGRDDPGAARAETISDDAFLQFHRSVRERPDTIPDTREGLLAFLVAIVSRRALDSWRKEHTKKRGLELPHKTGDVLLGKISSEPTPEETAIAEDVYDYYVHRLLPPELGALVERQVAGLEVAEIAEEMGLSARTVRRRLDRAREMILRQSERAVGPSGAHRTGRRIQLQATGPLRVLVKRGRAPPGEIGVLLSEISISSFRLS